MKTFWKIVLGSLLGCLVAMLVCMFIFFGMLGSMASSTMKSGSAAPKTGSVLRIDKSCQRLRGEDVVVFVKTVVSWVARKTFRPGTASFHVRQGMPLSAFS